MFNGWLSFGGNEVLNDERTRAYANDLLPNLTLPTTCAEDNRGLAAMLSDEPYRTPMIDEAPWVDHDDPDTYGFCGALSLSVSGLTDSTRTATVVENAASGGSVVGRRSATKEVRVTALLLADSEASLSAGKRWLSAALDGGCDPCEPSELCFLVGTGGGEESMGDYTTWTILPKHMGGSPSYWASGTGVFTPPTTATYVWTPDAPKPVPCDEIFWHWKITSATPGTQIVLEVMSESGVAITSDVYTLSSTGGTFTVGDKAIPQYRTYCRLRVLTAPGETITIDSVDMEFREAAAEDACFTKYARQLKRVTCIAGPVTIEEYNPTYGAMEKVEFSFAAEMPHVYGLTQDILSVAGSNILMNKRTADVFQLSQTVPVCTLPKRTPLVADPDCPAIPAPPRSNVAVAACKADPVFQDSYALSIPDSFIPEWSEAVPILSMTTSSQAARKVRVRFMPRPFETQAPVDLDPCSSCGEFVIDYIPAYSTFVLDGSTEKAYIKQSGGRTSDAGHLLSGMTSSTLFEWPVLTCGTGYFAIVDTTTDGVGRFDLSIAVRE